MKVRVYRNLRTKSYSVQNAKTNIVTARPEEVLLYDAEFRVTEGGRQRVIRDKQKNVHAKVVGTLSPLSPRSAMILAKREMLVKVSYNPYKFGHFYEVGTERPVKSAEIVCLLNDGVYAMGVQFGEGG